jgi:hypothetical protein
VAVGLVGVRSMRVQPTLWVGAVYHLPQQPRQLPADLGNRRGWGSSLMAGVSFSRAIYNLRYLRGEVTQVLSWHPWPFPWDACF